MKTIKFIEGDATRPIGDGNKIIAHVCNDIGRWGKGFVVALSKRSPLPKAAFLKWYEERANNDYGLGAVQFVAVENGVWIANMIGQHKIASKATVEFLQFAMRQLIRHYKFWEKKPWKLRRRCICLVLGAV